MGHWYQSPLAPRIDWVQIMVDLHNAGCTSYRVHISLGVAYTTARHWANGTEPRYGVARALLRLHSRWCGSALTFKRMSEAEVCPDSAIDSVDLVDEAA